MSIPDIPLVVTQATSVETESCPPPNGRPLQVLKDGLVEDSPSRAFRDGEGMLILIWDHT